MGMTGIFGGEGEEIDVDKSWHLIHFLLTGQAEGGEWPLCFILQGGTHDGPDDAEGEDDDWGDDDGATQSYTPAQVREIAAALQPVTPEILAARWDPANPAAKEVYGFRPDDETRDYAVDYYTQVRELVLRLAETGSGLFVGIF